MIYSRIIGTCNHAIPYLMCAVKTTFPIFYVPPFLIHKNFYLREIYIIIIIIIIIIQLHIFTIIYNTHSLGNNPLKIHILKFAGTGLGLLRLSQLYRNTRQWQTRLSWLARMRSVSYLSNKNPLAC